MISFGVVPQEREDAQPLELNKGSTQIRIPQKFSQFWVAQPTDPVRGRMSRPTVGFILSFGVIEILFFRFVIN